jgi:hypothetical protein
MNATIAKDILTETYSEHENLIWEVVWRFWRKFGGDIEEIRANANLFFVEAYNMYDGTASLSTWLHRKIYHQLRRQIWYKYNRIVPMESIEDYEPNLPYHAHNPLHWAYTLEGVSEDVRTIMGMVFHPGGLTDEDLREGFRAVKTRMDIKRHLKDVGWTARRINESIAEIKELLHDEII